MSDHILQAIDNLHDALALLDLDPDSPALTALNNTVTNLDSIRASIEAQALAGRVAQNTNFTDLIAAIESLVLSCSPTINVSVPPAIVNCGGGTNVSGTKLEDTPVSSGDPPPEGFEPDPNIVSRQCVAANFIYDSILKQVGVLKVQDFDSLGSVGIIVAATMIGATLGSAGFGIGALPGAIAGALVGAVAELIAGVAVDLDDIEAVMGNTHEELICALSQAEDTATAKNDFLQVLEDGGINSVEALGFMGYFLVSDVLKMLFQAITFDDGRNSEVVLASYTPAVDCNSCGAGGECESTWAKPEGLLYPASTGNLIDVVFESDHAAHYFSFPSVGSWVALLIPTNIPESTGISLNFDWFLECHSDGFNCQNPFTFMVSVQYDDPEETVPAYVYLDNWNHYGGQWYTSGVKSFSPMEGQKIKNIVLYLSKGGGLQSEHVDWWVGLRNLYITCD